MNKRKPTVTLGHRLQIHERRTDDPKRKLHVKTPDALCWDRSLLSLTISSQTPPDSSKIRGRDIPSRLEQKRQRLSVYPAHLALNCRTYKYYHPRTNLNLAPGEGGGGLKKKRKNGLNCDSGSSPVYFLSLPTGLFILSSVLQKKRQNPKQNDYRSMSYIG